MQRNLLGLAGVRKKLNGFFPQLNIETKSQELVAERFCLQSDQVNVERREKGKALLGESQESCAS